MSKPSKRPPLPMPPARLGEPEQVTVARQLVVCASQKLMEQIESGLCEPIQLAAIIRDGMESLTAYASTMGDSEG